MKTVFGIDVAVKEFMPARFLTSKRPLGKGGFTMVELLLVIAIILILVALLMPTLGRIRETAKVAKCISNMRQLSIATFNYAADYGGLAPFAGDNGGNNGNILDNDFFTARSHDPSHSTYKNVSYYPKNKWFAEYLAAPGTELGKMLPVAYCPSGGRFGSVGPQSKNGYANFSYAINCNLTNTRWFYGWDHLDQKEKMCVPLAQVKNPGQVALWVESVRSVLYPKDAYSGRHYPTQKMPWYDQPVFKGNNIYVFHGMANVIFVDQHIGSFKTEMEAPIWSCKFWDHTAKVPCSDFSASGPCGWCHKENR